MDLEQKKTQEGVNCAWKCIKIGVVFIVLALFVLPAALKHFPEHILSIALIAIGTIIILGIFAFRYARKLFRLMKEIK